MASLKAFEELGLDPKVIEAVQQLGYEKPSPVQAQSIPILMENHDLMAQAQTGTGKTAAFALPILSKLSLRKTEPQALILAPTRELAIQVAEAFQSYAKHIPSFRVLPIYGGQEYRPQLRALDRGVHVVVGTPGRVMDHLRRGTLKTNALTTLVLDEADEMLRMGFLEDVEWVLEQIDHSHQTAFFSATIPTSIRQVAKRFLNNPKTIHIEPSVTTVTSVEQYYMLVAKKHKLDILARYFEIEDVDAALIFTGTKIFSVEVAEKLAARGYAAAALNGDMSQHLREQVISKLKRGKLDFVVATEVAARGLDVPRISHVINFDIPQAAESYIHRIGRTARAGRAGKTLLLVTPREQRMLEEIQRAVSHQIKPMKPPSVSQVQLKRAEKIKMDVMQTLASKNIDHYRSIVKNIVSDNECSELDIAAAALYLAHKETESSTREYEEVHFEAHHRRSDSSRRDGRPTRRRRPSARGFDRDKLHGDNRKPSGKRKSNASVSVKRKPDGSGGAKRKFGKKNKDAGYTGHKKKRSGDSQ